MKYVYMIFLLLFFVNCTGQKPVETPVVVKEGPLKFTMVTLPAVLTEPSERANYLVMHYWDNFDFSDKRYIDLPEITEQAFVDYIDILPHVSYVTASGSIEKMLQKAEADSAMFSYFAELYEKYLHDPNSPFRNEEFYIPVLESIINSSVVEETNKIRPLYLLDLALRNRVGEKAADFSYKLANGNTGTLYNVKADYTLLYFYNPDCNSCKEIMGLLADSPVVIQAIQERNMKVVAIYPDEDIAAWKAHLKDVPANWINGYDEGAKVKNEEIYDLKAIPTIYLLGKDKEVLLKDTTVEQLEHFLQQKDSIKKAS